MSAPPNNTPVPSGAAAENSFHSKLSIQIVPTTTSSPVGSTEALAQIYPFHYFALPPNFQCNIRAAPPGMYRRPGLGITGLNYTGGDILPGLPVTGPYAGNIPVRPNPNLPPLPDLPVAPVQNHPYPPALPQMPVGGSPVFVHEPASLATPANQVHLAAARVPLAAPTADLVCTATGPQDAPMLQVNRAFIGGMRPAAPIFKPYLNGTAADDSNSSNVAARSSTHFD
ncbi:hypothetical protein PCANC_25721 [Puccinia coronata f. sp. avenae]|uniref:Uncharacterized protein n=1 Tax=Puccinia coronata f. sp. avenae TaxID=200324 RepID=A0A2N5U7H7_9BASI|nr:hypothetical protein PCANC_25721 [Puccinia coronata f. sp. avenae]